MTTTTSSSEHTSSRNDAQMRAEEAMLRERMGGIRRKLLVFSGKGGVGKSTVAANLAAALGQTGERVGLLDIDVHGPSIPKLMGLEGQPVQAANGDIAPVRVNDNLVVMSIGFLLSSAKEPVIWRGPRKYHLIRQFLKDVAWGELDYLVVDSPPGTGDEPMSIVQLVGAPAGAIIVTTPQEVALSDVRRCVSFCNELSLPVVGIVENMSGFVCPKCGERIDLFKRGGGVALALEMTVPFLGQIPIDPEVVMAGDAGMPLVHDGPQSPASRAFSDVVDSILAADTEQESSDSEEIRRRHCTRIAIPIAGGNLSCRFGSCDEVKIFEVDEQRKQILGSSTHEFQVQTAGGRFRRLKELHTDVLLAADVPGLARYAAEQQGIEVVLCDGPKLPEQIVWDYLTMEARANAAGSCGE